MVFRTRLDTPPGIRQKLYKIFKRPSRKKCDAQVLVVGGGAVGTSIAYHLSKLGMKDVILLEKSQLTAGSTWHAAGLTALYHPGINMKKLHYYSINLYSQLEEETKQPLSFHRPGSIRLATTDERMKEFRYQMQRQRWQAAPQKIIDPQTIYELCPFLNMDGIIGGLYNPADGHIDPNSLTMAYAAGARKHGAILHNETPVTGMRAREDGKWEVNTSGGTIVANKVVNATGFWAHEVGRMVGVELPLIPVQHQYVVSKPIQQIKDLKKEPPVLRHLEGSFYMRAERGGLLVGPYEKPHKMKIMEDWSAQVPPGFGKELFQPDLDRLSDHLDVAMNLVPLLKETSIQTVVNGPIMYTPDLLPILGPFYGLRNMWMAVGFGYGIIHSGGAGKYLAEWMMKGEPPYDLTETDPNRFGKWTTKEYVLSKSRETYGMNNSYTYPKEERFAGRPTTRVSGAYQKMVERGAQMSFHSGWEQPAWFALDGDEMDYKPSFNRTNWFHPVGRECDLVMNKVGIIDLTPFAKFRITGNQAYQFLDQVLANKLPKIGRTNISHLLTKSGKVYGELTVTRLHQNEFLLITGSGSEIHDLRYLEEKGREMQYQDVRFENSTDELSCLSIAGPLSRKVLQKLTEENLEKNFPFLAVRVLQLGGVKVTAIRISYTGELGWELYHSSEDTAKLYESLLAAGEEFGIGDFGTYALNALRLEKGFRMWGAEMNMDTNPLEAGLHSFIDMKKEDFVGKSYLEDVLRKGLDKKLCYLKVDTEDVDPEGNECVHCSDKVVGYTTSGSYGYTVKHGVAFAYLPPFLTVPGTEVQVELLGKLIPATVLKNPPLQIESVRSRK